MDLNGQTPSDGASDNASAMYKPQPFIRRCPNLPPGGFTLIELVIAVAIVALLLAVALPSFMDSIRKSRRSDAYFALNAAVQAQERFRANNASYSSSLTNAVSDDPAGLGLSASTPNGYYGVTVSGASSTGYTATAVATSGKSQTSDGNCVQLRVRAASGNVFYGSSDGIGSFDETANNRCWSR